MYYETNSMSMKVNLNNSNEVAKLRSQFAGFLTGSSVKDHQPIPYRMDDLTEKGANYTILVPKKWKEFFSKKNLRQELRNEVDADEITIEYVDFVRE